MRILGGRKRAWKFYSLSELEFKRHFLTQSKPRFDVRSWLVLTRIHFRLFSHRKALGFRIGYCDALYKPTLTVIACAISNRVALMNSQNQSGQKFTVWENIEKPLTKEPWNMNQIKVDVELAKGRLQSRRMLRHSEKMRFWRQKTRRRSGLVLWKHRIFPTNSVTICFITQIQKLQLQARLAFLFPTQKFFKLSNFWQIN